MVFGPGNQPERTPEMKRFFICVAFSTLVLVSPAPADPAPGLIERQINAQHHGREMGMVIWYPAAARPTERFAENAVFEGGEVIRDAPPLPGKYPVVLMSHGMGGTYMSLNWLASGLSAKGAIVISVNHPNGWFRDRQMDKMFDHWTRVQDLQAALDSVVSDKVFANAVDPDRIYATGFSFGGWTALSLGGATANPSGVIDYCEAARSRSHNCMDLKHFGIDPAKLNPAKWTASYKDPRIKAVVSLDPGLTWKLDASNVRDIDQTKLLIIGLGNETERHYATDTTVKGSGFDALVPNARIEVISPSTHFTAMPLCTPKGAAILAEEKDDPVCTDPAGTNRKAVHERIIALMAEHFGLGQASTH
jgi:predicted dienelactone hydrolase